MGICMSPFAHAAGGAHAPVIRQHLPGTRIMAMATDQERFLWFGTDQGPVRYDGFEWKALATRAEDRVAVSALVVDDDGSLWIGRRGARPLLRAKNGELQSYDSFDVTALVRHEGAVWIGTGAGLFRIVEGQVTAAHAGTRHGERLARLVIRDLLSVRDGALWIVHADGIDRLQNDNIATVELSGSVEALAQDTQGRIWSASHLDKGAFLYDAEGTKIGEADVNSTNDLLADGEGGMWFASDNGLFHSDHNRVVRKVAIGTGVDSRLQSLARDAEGVIWVGTSASGALRLDETPIVRVLGAESGMRSEFGFSVAEDGAGGVWTSTTTDLTLWHAGGVDVFPYGPSYDLPYDLRSVFPRSDDGIWAASSTGGVRQISVVPGQPPSVTLVHNKGTNIVYEDAKGTLWFGWEKGGLGRLVKGGEIQEISMPSISRVSVLAPSRSGDLWIATQGGGVLRFKNGEGLDQYDGRHRLSDDHVNALTELRDGGLCVSTDAGGIDCLEHGRFFHYGARESVTDELVTALVEDRQGALWLGTTAGILRLSGAPRQGQPIVAPDAFGLSSGLRSAECVRGPGRSGLLLSTGQIVFPTTSGLALIDPSVLQNKTPPPILIDTLILNGKESPPPNSANWEKPVGDGNLEIRYAAPRFAGADTLRFRYQLEGQDRTFIEAGSRRSAFYTNLNPGLYRFTVEVAEGPRSSRTMLQFSLRAPFYRTPYFLFAFFVVLAAAAFGVLRLRSAQQRARSRAIAEERQRLARDLHDTVEQSVVAVRLQLDAAIQDLMPHAAQHTSALAHATRGVELLGQASTGMRNAIFALRLPESRSLELPMAISQTAGRLLRGTEIQFEVESIGATPALTGQHQQQILSIMEESLTNAIKHAETRSLKVSIDNSAGDLKISLVDAGIGFDVSKEGPVGHFGLVGMRERARQIGATLSIESQPGRGTMIVVVLPRTRRSS
jgi:signal transduction histidine kinase/ligand-binding sensor domain-containing protein